MNYRSEMVSRFWTYQATQHPEWSAYLEPRGYDARPPVFVPEQADRNVITPKGQDTTAAQALLGFIRPRQRHKWFRSMTSSQALAQSVFGNLAVSGRLDRLCDVKDDEGRALVEPAVVSSQTFSMEHQVDHLGEPRPTSLDVQFGGVQRVAFECKLTEQEVGTCSRPRLETDDPQYCDGSYALTASVGLEATASAPVRCPLVPLGVRYWQFVPRIFTWAADRDWPECPLNKNYQLVRNVLAVCVGPNDIVSPTLGYAVLVYDDRNPAFQSGGRGDAAFRQTTDALRPEYASVLRRCTWQRIVAALRQESALGRLTDELGAKYGL